MAEQTAVQSEQQPGTQPDVVGRRRWLILGALLLGMLLAALDQTIVSPPSRRSSATSAA